MRQHRVAPVLTVLVVAAVLVAGCAGPSAAPSMALPAVSAGDLVGTWNGTFWALGSFYYPVDGTLLLQVEEDGTFTVTMTPDAAANNIAKAASWSGTIGQRGDRVVFHLAKGQWPAWSSLEHAGDTLYGVANDPGTGFDIGVELTRAGHGS